MIFKRRVKRSIWEKARDLVSPKKGWRRGFKYIGRRVQRLPDTPHRIAIGFACGALASFSPFFTLHALVAVIFAWMVRGNLLAGAFGTMVGNPFSFPLIAAVSLKTGNWLLGRDDGIENLDQLSFAYVSEQPLQFLESIFTPYLIGGIAPGLICAAACYFAIRPIVARFQERRRGLLADRARALVAKRKARSRAAVAAEEDEEEGGAASGAKKAVAGPSIAAMAKSGAAKPIERIAAALPPPLRPRRPADGPR